MGYSESFIIAVITSLSASCLIAVRWCYRSKCRRIRCCGLDIERDVEGEEHLDEISPQSPTNSNKMNRTISL
jgi:hypothetical protein